MYFLRIVCSLVAGCAALIAFLVTFGFLSDSVTQSRASGMWGGTLGDLMEGKHRQVQTEFHWREIGKAILAFLVAAAASAGAYFVWPRA